VFAAACIIPRGVLIEGINDSKKLSSGKRESVFSLIKSNKDVLYAVGVVDERQIDEMNILQASYLAMYRAINNLSIKPDYILFDGKSVPRCRIDSMAIDSMSIVHGDALSFLIAAASIIAKCSRDAVMTEYHKKYPEYGWNTNKGYGTKAHIAGLKEHGMCEHHRKTFKWQCK
jgi:ribonuclease HII